LILPGEIIYTGFCASPEGARLRAIGNLAFSSAKKTRRSRLERIDRSYVPDNEQLFPNSCKGRFEDNPGVELGRTLRLYEGSADWFHHNGQYELA
jgi:hypothetical protein